MTKIISVITVSLTILVGLGYFFTMSGGRPIGTDLSVIGQGRPVLVLAYENFSPAGGDALNRLRSIRSDYDSRLDFVVADLATPQGHSLASRYKLVDGQAIFLKQDGQPLNILFIAADERELRGLIDSNLAIVE
jgi:hypothetical protein